MEILDTIQSIHLTRGMVKNSSAEFDISSVIDNLKKDHHLETEELNSKVLLKSQKMNIVLVKMQKGTEIKSMQQNLSVTFRILQGKLKLHIRNGSLTINEGESLILYEKTKYTIASMAATALLLTLTS